jgi:hypothetical protein
MGHCASTNHIQINIDHTLNQMRIRLHRGRVITILPKRTIPTFPLIIFLTCSARDQLHRLGDNVSSLVISYNKVNRVGGHCIVQDGGSKTLLCLKKPLQPSTLIPGKLQQKFSLMAPMSNVPYIPRQIVSVSPCQIYDLLETQFLVKECGSKTEIPIIYQPFFYNIKPLPWSDPHLCQHQ